MSRAQKRRGRVCSRKTVSWVKSRKTVFLPQKGHTARVRLKDSPSDDISSSSSSEFIHSGEETSTVKQHTLFSRSAPVQLPTLPRVLLTLVTPPPAKAQRGQWALAKGGLGLLPWAKGNRCQTSQATSKKFCRRFLPALAQPYTSLLHMTGCALPLHWHLAAAPDSSKGNSSTRTRN